ncbi:MAG: hypothetical protein WC659_01920 [Patescibacteria group bacterium]
MSEKSENMFEVKLDRESEQSVYLNLEIARTPELDDVVNHAKELVATVENDRPVTVGQVHNLEESINGLTIDVEGEECLIDNLSSLIEEDVKIWHEIEDGNVDNTYRLTFCPPNILRRIILIKQANSPIEGITVWLNSLKSISYKTAQELSSVRRLRIELDGLNNLPVEIAEILGKSSVSISLNGMKSLTPKVATCLAKIPSKTLGIKEISSEVADCLFVPPSYPSPAYTTDWLKLNNLTTLSVATAKALARVRGPLELNGLTALDSDIAKELVKHENKIMLNGLQAVDMETAKILAQFTFRLDVPQSVDLIIDQYKPQWRQKHRND